MLALQGIVFIIEASQTTDEGVHLAAGYSSLVAGDYRLSPDHPPLIRMLAALPLVPLHLEFPLGPLWEQAFVHENRVPNDTLLLLGRLPILALSLVLGFAIYRFGSRLFGTAGGLLGLTMWVLDPNVVAHSGLVTTDVGIALFMFLAVIAFWSWIETPSPGRLALFGLAVGGAFASKHTALWLLVVLGVIAVALVLAGDATPQRLWAGARTRDGGGLRAGRVGSPWRRLAVLAAAGLAAAAIAAVVLLLTYRVGQIGWWFTGLDQALNHSAIGHRAYLHGQISETGWWYYFPLAWALKTPPGIIALVAATVAAALYGRRLRPRDEIVLWVPIVVILSIMMIWKVNIGLRHLLPIYPFLCVASGRLLWWKAEVASPTGNAPRSGGPPPGGASIASRLGLAGITLAIGAAAWETAMIAPDYLVYFNRFAGGPGNGHRWLLDSNLSWGQAHRALRRYMEREKVSMVYCAFSGTSDPWYYGVHYQYVPGALNLKSATERPARMPDVAQRELLAIDAVVLHSLYFNRPDVYDWLLERKPLATPGYTWFVYDITREADSHARIADVSVQFSLLELAEFEAQRALGYEPGNPLARAVQQALADHRVASRLEPLLGSGTPGTPAPHGTREGVDGLLRLQRYLRSLVH